MAEPGRNGLFVPLFLGTALNMARRNRSNEGIVGLDDPNLTWLRRVVRVKSHPEWGIGRVLRWFPSMGDQPERLRIMPENNSKPQLVDVTDVELVGET
ncbi:hypothetical protein ACFL6C_11590 [Myxococcota bacterium]